MRLCLLTDRTYALATIATTYEMAKLNFFSTITIIQYPAFNEPIFFGAIKKIQELSGQSIQVLTLKDSPFKAFEKKFHFTSIVFVKLMLPELFKDKFITFIDSGYLIPNPQNFKKWLNNTIFRFKNSDLPLAIRSSQYNTKGRWSVAGGFIIFNKDKYHEIQALERMIQKFQELLPTNLLQMPEQDLINYTLGESELLAIYDYPYYKADLTEYAKLTKRGISSLEDLAESYSLFKFSGSMKPWHLWVTNPDKQIFLRKIYEISNFIEIPLHSCFSLYQLFPSKENTNWLTDQLKAHSFMLAKRRVL